MDFPFAEKLRMFHYGQIEEIWELSYLGFKVPVFGVDGIREDRVS